MDSEVQGYRTLDIGILKKSIKELRPLFPNMSEYEFAVWYSKRYKITTGLVLTILEGQKEEGQ